MIPFEIFAAKDEAGLLKGVMLAAPVDSGLREADILRLVGSRLLAFRGRSVLPIDLPELDSESRALLEAAGTAGRLPVAEFTALGLSDTYLVGLDVDTAAPASLPGDGYR